MAYREPVSRVQDAKIFQHTADKTKRINVMPSVMRGGTRL